MSFRLSQLAVTPFVLGVILGLSACGDGANVGDNTRSGVLLDSTEDPLPGGTTIIPLNMAGAPEEISSATQGDVEEYQTVVDGSGNITAVWLQRENNITKLWGNRYTANTASWSSPELLETETQSASSPKIVVDSNGVVTLVWIQGYLDTYVVQPFSAGPPPQPEIIAEVIRTDLAVRRYTPGVGWELTASSFLKLESSDLTAQQTEQLEDIGDFALTVDNNNEVTVVWTQHNATLYNLYGIRNVAGTWDVAPTLLDTEDLGSVTEPQLVRKGNDVLVLWLQDDGANKNLWGDWYSAGWQMATKIDSEDLGDVSEGVKAVIDSGGNATVVWAQDDSARWNLWGARFAGAWGAAAKLEAEDLGDVSLPEVVVDSSDNVTVAWTQSDGAVSNVWAKRYASGWQIEAKIETEDAGTVGDLAVVVDGANAVTAVWTQSNGTVVNLWANRFTGAWGTAVKVETTDNGDANEATLLVDSSNRVMAIWTQANTGRLDIWSNVFASGGWGTAELVETLDDRSAVSVIAAQDLSGNTRVVWQQTVNSLSHLLTNVYTVGSGWGDVELLEDTTYNYNSGYLPSLVASGADLVALWLQPIVPGSGSPTQTRVGVMASTL